MALVLALSALVITPAASAAAPPEVTNYIALGDSLAFGYSQEVFEANFPNDAPAYFEKGYTDYVKTKLKKESKGITLINNGCPGDTTDGIIGENPALGGAKDAAHFPCPYHNVSGLPLHNNLPGKVSGLESAMSILKGGSPVHPVKLVTLNGGGNDELAVISSCTAKVKKEVEEKGFTEENEKKEPSGNIPEAINFCIASTAVSVTFPHITKNLETMVLDLAVGGKYTGPIVILGNYNPQSFALPGSDGLQIVLNSEEAAMVVELKAKYGINVKFVNPFSTFNAGTEGSTKEKKSLEKYTEYFNAKDIAVNKAKKEASNKKEEEEGKTVIFPSSGTEGDIHPSEVGFKKLGVLIYNSLP